MAPQDASRLRSPSWVGQPDDDDDEATQITRGAISISSAAWFVLTTTVFVAMLLQSRAGPLGFWAEDASFSSWQAPWWLTAIFAAEAYASFRRLLFKAYHGGSGGGGGGTGPLKQRERRIRPFTSLRLAKGAPIDEIVARFLALDSLEEVRSVELGTNAAPDSSESRGHHLALMVTFAGGQQRARYLASAARAEFLSFIEPFVADTFAIDFESGLVQ